MQKTKIEENLHGVKNDKVCVQFHNKKIFNYKGSKMIKFTIIWNFKHLRRVRVKYFQFKLKLSKCYIKKQYLNREKFFILF